MYFKAQSTQKYVILQGAAHTHDTFPKFQAIYHQKHLKQLRCAESHISQTAVITPVRKQVMGYGIRQWQLKTSSNFKSMEQLLKLLLILVAFVNKIG